MGDITRNISRHEFACQCGCGSDTVDYELPFVLQRGLDYFNAIYPLKDVKIHINSGTRCMFHNVKVGGKPEEAGKPGSGSQHLYGRAADFYYYDKVTGEKLSDDETASFFEDRYKDRFGIGRYVGRTHLDTKTGGPRRWDKR